MKKSSVKLNQFQASLVIACVVSLLLMIVGIVFAILKQPGWMIGVAIGSLVSFFHIWLMDVGSKIALKEGKAGLFLLTYFIRIVVFIGLFALLVVLQFVLHVEVFNNSCWAMLIAFVPSTFITIATQLMYKNEESK